MAWDELNKLLRKEYGYGDVDEEIDRGREVEESGNVAQRDIGDRKKSDDKMRKTDKKADAVEEIDVDIDDIYL